MQATVHDTVGHIINLKFIIYTATQIHVYKHIFVFKILSIIAHTKTVDFGLWMLQYGSTFAFHINDFNHDTV